MSNPKLNSAPDLKALPPKNEAYEEHVYRAHLQTAVWKAALDADPPSINPVHYGWSLESSDTLLSVALPRDVSPALDDVLKLIRCGCLSSRPCSTCRCSSSAAQLSCSMFCACHDNNECNNDYTRTAASTVDDEDTADEKYMYVYCSSFYNTPTDMSSYQIIKITLRQWPMF